jgi:glyoxylase-like metal-dependent hydrolase (beta-lactamase superfamily II)
MEIFPGVHQIRSDIADRHLYQYLFVGDRPILLDTGTAASPDEAILPYLRGIGLPDGRLALAVNTHADADHHGGNTALRERCESIELACGADDRAVIEDPDLLFRTRYNAWLDEHGAGLGTNPAAEAWVRGMVGRPHRIDSELHGGETLSIDGRRGLEVLHVPGHTAGHLAFYDRANRAVFTGDALHGAYCPARNGAPSLPPIYFPVAAYLETISQIEGLDVDWIYSAHWPPFGGDALKGFLDECRGFVRRVDEKVARLLEGEPAGVSLKEAIAKLGPALGDWPETNRWLLMYPVHAHLVHFEQTGRARRLQAEGVPRWVAV